MVAAAMVGAAVIGAAASNSAANKSASASKAGLKSSNALAAQSRSDALNLFGQGRTSAQQGIGGALDFYGQNSQKQIQPMIQGNMMAQQVAGQGGIQANNAILGLPVDMSFANNPQQVQADYSGINNARLPVLGANYTGGLDAAGNPIAATPQKTGQNLSGVAALDQKMGAGKDGYVVSPLNPDTWKPQNLATNPLLLGKKNADKLNPVKRLKKLF